MADIELRRLVKEYPGGVRAVDGLDLTIADGEFFALLGPSGCGKTTLLRSIAGLETVSGGHILIGGRDVTGLAPGARDIAMVFQDYALFPHMTVRDNIAYPLRIKKMGRPERQAKAEETAEGLSLGGLLDRRPGQLSGGQQQRAALARAVACHPKVFLFDEPLSNLDARLRLEARTFLKRLQRDLGVTTVFVTHDQAEALAMSDRMAVMDAGRIRQIGTPTEVFQRPASTFVASFIGSTPEYMTLHTAAEPTGIEGVVAIVENMGVGSLVSLEVPGAAGGASIVQVTVPEGQEPEIGSRGWAVAAPERVLLYRHDDGELVGSERAGAGEPVLATAGD
jgi:multiple sugar transport system ATP-binding protein